MIRTTLDQARYFILQKNYLAPDKAPNVSGLARDVAGLPAAFTPAPFLSARARVADFHPHHLLTGLYQERSLILGILMRNTTYIVATMDYVTLYAATARQRKQGFNSEFRLWGVENSQVEDLGAAILEAIGDRPASLQSIEARLPQNLVRELTQTSRGGRVTRISNVALVLRWLVAEGQLCILGDVESARQDWRIESPLYAPMRYGYPGLDLKAARPESEAQAALARAYLAGFGPATEADISFWTGFGKSETARVIGALSAETTLVMVDGIPGVMLLLKNQAEALGATQIPHEPIINVLPADDLYVTAHRASRARLLSDPKLQRPLFSGSGEVKPTIVVNGQIVGTWEWQTEDGQDKITWRLLTQVDPTLLPRIQTEVEHAGAFIHPDILIEQRMD